MHICIHPSNKVALSIGCDNTMRMWNLVQGKASFSRKFRERALKVLFSPDSKRYAILFGSKAIVYNLSDGQEVYSVEIRMGLSDMTFMESGDFVVVGNDKKIHIYGASGESWYCIYVIYREIRSIVSNTELRLRTVEVVHVPKEDSDTPLLVTGSSDGSIQLWDVYAEKENLLASVKTSERITCCTSLMKL